MFYIGIDLGTSAVKLVMMQGDGTIVRIVSKEYPLYFPHPGWSEQEPEDWWKAVQEGLQELLQGQDAQQVAGISFGGQMHGLVALDAEDHVIRPAILWNDGRTAEETDFLNTVEERQRCPSIQPILPLRALPRPRSCGCAAMSRRISAESLRSCCPRIISLIS